MKYDYFMLIYAIVDSVGIRSSPQRVDAASVGRASLMGLIGKTIDLYYVP